MQGVRRYVLLPLLPPLYHINEVNFQRGRQYQRRVRIFPQSEPGMYAASVRKVIADNVDGYHIGQFPVVLPFVQTLVVNFVARWSC